MAGHHRGRRPAVRHARAELIDAVAARGVAEHIDAVRVHVFQHHEIGDEAVEKRVEMVFVPQLPGVRGRPRRDIEPLLRAVSLGQRDLVAPLAVIDFRGCAAATVQREEKAAPARRGRRVFAKRHDLKLQLVLPDADGFRLELVCPCRPQKRGVIRPQQLARAHRGSFRQRHFRKRCVAHRRALRAWGGQPSRQPGQRVGRRRIGGGLRGAGTGEAETGEEEQKGAHPALSPRPRRWASIHWVGACPPAPRC